MNRGFQNFYWAEVMDWKVFSTVFLTVFLAEIGDKTQLATMLFAGQSGNSKWMVFLGSALALVLISGISVGLGAFLVDLVPKKTLSTCAGILFILIGSFTLIKG